MSGISRIAYLSFGIMMLIDVKLYDWWESIAHLCHLVHLTSYQKFRKLTLEKNP